MAGSGTSGGRGQGSPVRRPSPAVYRRRRLVVLMLAVLVVAGIVAAGVWVASLVGAGREEASAEVAASGSTQFPGGQPRSRRQAVRTRTWSCVPQPMLRPTGAGRIPR